ncbi:hypothetical protein GOC83_05115 [Haloarcula rubripromontorii]|uniref:DUF7974 domain-containing protein n=1 Tax=Haloarcula rubripromontorii TaxID=1705562 RepID=A0A847TY91_9EURY|nr:hypothetical protein [Haloarcula rubripromontorii]NLV05516.1 hypothetical protein [Haloarcula rubripromontorii]
MRRIYDSGALHRDDEEPQAPTERGGRPQAARSINGRAWSDLLLPTWLRYRAVAVDIEVPQMSYPAETKVPFVVTIRNELPVPITLPTDSPRPWTWYVDGVPEASHVDSVPGEAGSLRFDRGERKQFRRQWDRMFRVSDDEWEPAPAGEYTLSAKLSIANAGERGLYSETTVRISEQ